MLKRDDKFPYIRADFTFYEYQNEWPLEGTVVGMKGKALDAVQITHLKNKGKQDIFTTWSESAC